MRKKTNRSMSKSIISTILVVALLAVFCFSTLAGCSEKSPSQSSGPKESKANTADTTKKESKEEGESSSDDTSTKKLTIGVQPDAYGLDMKDNYVVQFVEEETNIDVEFYLFPADKEGTLTKISALVASSEKLPDMIGLNGVLDGATIYEYGSKGVFLDVEPYYEDESLVPYFYDIPEETRDYIMQTARSADGHIYAMPHWHEWSWNNGPYRMWVNEHWVEKSGKDIPTTTDEFYEMLQYFANNDMNENGVQDEIPMAGSARGWGTDIFTFLMNSFVYTDPGRSYMTIENGQISPTFVTEEFRSGLEYIQRLVSEHLISPISFTQDTDQYKALLAHEGGMVGFAPAGSYSMFTPGTALEFDEMTLVAPLIGPKGEQNATYSPTQAARNTFITKDCEDVETAITFGQWFYQLDSGIGYQRYGEKGVEWGDDPEIAKLYTNNFIGYPGFEDVSIKYYVLEDKWGTENDKIWGSSIMPRYCPEFEQLCIGSMLIEEKEQSEGKPADKPPYFEPQYFMEYKPCFPEESIGPINYLPEEQEEVAILQTQIVTYVDEMMTLFVTGEASLDKDWDNYLDKLNQMGLEQYLELFQTAYDRTAGNS